MNKFKDFLYDKSDITVAFIIICIAGLVIFSRINAILAYPEAFASSIPSPTVTEKAIYVDNSEKDESVSTQSAINGEPEEMLAIYINYGESLQVIAGKFVSVNLFKTEEDFFAAVEAEDASVKIKTGNFIIPSNATPEEIIAIITKPGL